MGQQIHIGSQVEAAAALANLARNEGNQRRCVELGVHIALVKLLRSERAAVMWLSKLVDETGDDIGGVDWQDDIGGVDWG